MCAVANNSRSPLTRSVGTLWGVGKERVAQLARLNVLSIGDLLLHRPRRYEDRRHFRPISELTTDEAALTRGTVVASGRKHWRKGSKSVFELVLDDGTARLHCRWWNCPFMEKYFVPNDEVVVFGRMVGYKPRTMDHPETEVVEAGEERFIHFDRITPIHPLTEGMSARWLRALIWRTLERHEGELREPCDAVEEKGGARSAGNGSLRAAIELPTLAAAVRMIQFPENLEDIEIARQRLALREFVDLQMQLQGRRKRFEAEAKGLPCGGEGNRLMRPFLRNLGFQLTGSQAEVLREIRQDLAGGCPMRRLLQGDVGSGKTVVAACAALMALECGFNVALMAPTEILAEQHHLRFQEWFAPLQVSVRLRTGSRKIADDGAQVRSESGTAKGRRPFLTIGTHALISAGFELPDLGLVIMDEQQKFGVATREALVRKGRHPHVLVMTATPIPRTLGLTLYGDLDVSVMRASPPGRGQVRTFVRSAERLPKVWAFVREKLALGRQAYIVYPRVEETEGGVIKAVTHEFEQVREQVAPFEVGLLHGRLAVRQRQEVIREFRANRVQALVSTSLIEVGVDVPNATLMVIENAEQFGLSQLHQLRGRIGRGAEESWCVLVAAAGTPEARARLRALEESDDGFEIAEMDLKLRGPGEFLGRQQSGLPRFRFGNLAGDLELIWVARELAAKRLG